MKVTTRILTLTAVLALAAAHAQTTNLPGIPIFGGNSGPTIQNVQANGSGQVLYPGNFWTANASNSLTGLAPVNATVYVSINGNDTTAQLGRPEFPCATFTKANLLAFPVHGTVVVEPGLYTANNILTNGVNYFFATGAKVFWTPATTNNVSDYWAIFDDRACGPTTNIISGQGDYFWQGYTNSITAVNMTTGGSNQNLSGMCGGVLVITNPASSITMSANSIQCSSWTELGSAAITAAFGNLTVNVNWMADPAAGTNLVFTNTVLHNTANKTSSSVGVAWNCGTQHIHCWSNACGISGTRGNNYALWGNGFGPTDVGDFYYEGDYIGGKVYLSFQTTNSVSWIHAKRIEPINGGGGTTGNPLTLFGSQKTYVYADKMAPSPQSLSIAAIDENIQSGTSNTLAWIYTGKLAASNVFFNIPFGSVYMNVLQLEDLSGGACTNQSTAGLSLRYIPGPIKLGAFFLTNPIVNGATWTNTTGTEGTLTVNYSLPSATASLGMTNQSNGEWFNGTNATGSFSRAWKLQPMDVILISNKNGSPTLDASRFSP